MPQERMMMDIQKRDDVSHHLTSIAQERSILTNTCAGTSLNSNAIHSAVPNFCPRSYAHGAMTSSPKQHFLATDFLELGGSGSTGSGESLAAKLAKLHTTPAPSDKFGFPVPNCCGETEQDNSFRESWATFFAGCRLKHIVRNTHDRDLKEMVHTLADRVVPRLLGDDHLKGIKPVVCHGDLWSGNHGRGSIDGGAVEEVVYDPSCVYGHSESDLGIMCMFGGFGPNFWREYHSLVPKCEPVDEYEDRVSLYEL